MRYDRRDIGTGMTDDEVASFTADADVAAVWAYRSAVAARTRDVVRTLPPEAWDQTVGAEDITRAARAGAFRADVSSLVAAGKHPWQGHTRADHSAAPRSGTTAATSARPSRSAASEASGSEFERRRLL